MNDKDLKVLIKEELGFTREPKNLNAFYAFYTIYKAKLAKDKRTGKYNLAGISRDKLQSLGLNSKAQKKYWDVIVDEFMIHDDGSTYVKKQVTKQIVKWSDKWINLIEKIGLKLELPLDFAQKFYYKVEIDLKLSGRQFYTSTKLSPNRRYHPDCVKPKEDRMQKYNDCYHIDLEAAFASIAYNLLDFDNPYKWLLNDKMALRNKIMDSYNCDYKEAKTISQFLFTNKTWTTKDCDWLHSLHCDISHTVYELINNTYKQDLNLNSHHKFFTYHERQIIDTYVAQNNLDIALYIHDEIISKTKPSSYQVDYLGNTYYFSLEYSKETKQEAHNQPINDSKQQHVSIHTIEATKPVYEANMETYEKGYNELEMLELWATELDW